MNNEKILVVNLEINENGIEFPDSISEAFTEASKELNQIDDSIIETEKTIFRITPECDKCDYALAVSSGALCGLIDVFLVGKPGESPIGDVTDQWFAERTIDFAKMCGYRKKDVTLSSAIRYLEDKFEIPYDQSIGGEIFKSLGSLTPSNHHFKSLGHNPTILGLFFSIMNQFTNTSDFVSNGEHISLKNSDKGFELRGNNILSKFFCGFANWIGHIISDVSGSHSSKGRGMGIPSPLLSWSNDVITIKRKLNIVTSEFDKTLNEVALMIFEKGHDVRFQTAQMVPVFINDMVVRFLYSTRRLINYYLKFQSIHNSIDVVWDYCEPFSNGSIKRMLTVAHGTFCLVDVGEAIVRGIASGDGKFDVFEFVMRINVAGIGRFTISLYNETKLAVQQNRFNNSLKMLKKEKNIVEDYIAGLGILSKLYDDEELLSFISGFKSSYLYQEMFLKSVDLAKLRKVDEEKFVNSKTDIDNYFQGVILK